MRGFPALNNTTSLNAITEGDVLIYPPPAATEGINKTISKNRSDPWILGSEVIRSSVADNRTRAMEAFQYPRRASQAAYVFTYRLAVVGTIVLRSINIPGFIWGCGGEGGGRD